MEAIYTEKPVHIGIDVVSNKAVVTDISTIQDTLQNEQNSYIVDLLSQIRNFELE